MLRSMLNLCWCPEVILMLMLWCDVIWRDMLLSWCDVHPECWCDVDILHMWCWCDVILVMMWCWSWWDVMLMSSWWWRWWWWCWFVVDVTCHVDNHVMLLWYWWYWYWWCWWWCFHVHGYLIVLKLMRCCCWWWCWWFRCRWYVVSDDAILMIIRFSQ